MCDIKSDKQFFKNQKMETNKNEKKEIRTNGNVVKNFASILKLISIPSAIIAGALILKNSVGKPVVKLESDFDFLNYLLFEKNCKF